MDGSQQLKALTARKLAGAELAGSELAFVAAGAADGSLADGELIEWLRAVCASGLSYAETLALTRAMAASGAQLRWEGLPGPLVDKHSTGGVGDAVSLLLAPWAASAGLCLVKMSGRALGHTGGTADKLASIPGFRINLDPAEMADVMHRVGCCIAVQSGSLVPADKRLYALRDQSGTVMQMGLIAASVLSKKLAAGAPAFVLEVTCGNGALFQSRAEAEAFARLALRLAADCGRRCACVISAMDEPLGRAIGNLLEVGEVLDLLEGQAASPRLVELTAALAAVLLQLSGLEPSLEAAHRRLRQRLDHGAVRERFFAWLAAQGADLDALIRLRRRQAQEYRRIEVHSECRAYVSGIDTAALGRFVHSLERAGGLSDPLCGLLWEARRGQFLDYGDQICTAIASPTDSRGDGEIATALRGCLALADKRAATSGPVLGLVQSPG